MLEFRISKTDNDLKLYAEMYRAYLEYLGEIGHDCITNCKLPKVEEEVRGYDLINGGQIIALLNGKAVGCIGLEKIDENCCEMKRMFVLPEYQRQGIGRKLAEAIIAEAKKMGYKTMKLSTLHYLESAVHIYRSMGFYDIDPYYGDDYNDVIYLEIKL